MKSHALTPQQQQLMTFTLGSNDLSLIHSFLKDNYHVQKLHSDVTFKWHCSV